MEMIRPNCRVQFSAEDIRFILQTLGYPPDDPGGLGRLLADEESRDQILDDERIFQAIIGHAACLPVSLHLYFYVVVRRVLREVGLEDRVVADYIAEVLAEFSRQERVTGVKPKMEYAFEMLAALEQVDDISRFFIRAHLGNVSLFWAGVFPRRITSRSERKGFPDLSYYDQLGRSSFREAGNHRLAPRYDVDGVFPVLAERYDDARSALNELAERILFVGEG